MTYLEAAQTLEHLVRTATKGLPGDGERKAEKKQQMKEEKNE